jgi:hypothetical protein
MKRVDEMALASVLIYSLFYEVIVLGECKLAKWVRPRPGLSPSLFFIIHSDRELNDGYERQPCSPLSFSP